MEPSTLHTHWHAHFENLQLSSKEFYDEVETLIDEKVFPDVSYYRYFKNESSYFMAKREYLCIKRNDMSFLICAAPFGKNFFISYFLVENPAIFAQILLIIPFIGRRWYEWIKKKTYYQIDNELIFKESIKRIVSKAVDVIGEKKGVRLEVFFESITEQFKVE